MATKKEFSFESLNLTKQCAEAFEVEYVTPDGTKTGVFISVIGKHSERVRQFSLKEIDRRRMRQENNARQGKSNFIESAEDEDHIIKDAAVRIVGWRGIDQPYSPEAAEKLCRINSVIRELAVSTSNDLANFTKGK